MTGLLAYTIAAFGLAYILGHSVITQRMREILYRGTVGRIFVTLLECPACLGFWVGLLTGIGIGASWWMIPLLALYTAGSNAILGKLTKIME